MAKMKAPENETPSRADERAGRPSERFEDQRRNSSGDAPDEQSRIARRAYELYLERGGSHGQDWDDWLTAEREIRGR